MLIGCLPTNIFNQNITILNMPMQYAAIFLGWQNGNFQMNNFDIFLIFAQNIDRGIHIRTASLRQF